MTEVTTEVAVVAMPPTKKSSESLLLRVRAPTAMSSIRSMRRCPLRKSLLFAKHGALASAQRPLDASPVSTGAAVTISAGWN